jgi:hypothetical protein
MGMISPEKFDPFTDRTARDIRNALSEAFVTALGAMDSGHYMTAAQQWRGKNLSALYTDYIDNRLLNYARVFNAVHTGNVNDPLQQALIIWNQGLFFEFHDHLEALWKSETGDMRQALKGLIKAAGVYIHLEQDHQQAAESLAAKAHALLQQYRHCLSFIANPEGLLDRLKAVDPDPPRLDMTSFRD